MNDQPTLEDLACARGTAASLGDLAAGLEPDATLADLVDFVTTPEDELPDNG